MKKYFYTDGVTNFGPFALDELREQQIAPDTQVWYEGLSGWVRAGEVPELLGLFPQGLPTFNPTTQATPPKLQPNQLQKPPKTWLLESILVTIFCCAPIPLGIVAIIYATKVESRYYAGDHQGALRASKDAELWVKITVGVAIAGLIISTLFGLLPFSALFFNGLLGDFH